MSTRVDDEGPRYRESWKRDADERRRARLPMLEELWRQRLEFQALVVSTVPRIRRFYNELEMLGDIEAAVQTGALRALFDEGLATSESDHLTSEKLKAGCFVWRLRWVGHGALAVDRSTTVPIAEVQWHEVVLRVKVDREARSIDTEFFSLNESAGDTQNPYDDREKLHVVWRVPHNDSPLELQYLGFGTNEPYDLDHPGRAKAASVGRPRFYIYDRRRAIEMSYDVSWMQLGSFDWDWTIRPIHISGDVIEVDFVQLLDGSRHCLADREIVNAAADLNEQRMLDLTWKAMERDDPPPPAAELSPETASLWRSRFPVLRARVEGPNVRPTGTEPPPTIGDVLVRAGRDYPAYFAATSAARTGIRSQRQLLRGIRQLDPTRRDEYERILDARCDQVFVEHVGAVLPTTMRELLELDTTVLPVAARAAVSEWLDHLASQIDKDLYHYGQLPVERVHRLRLGAWIATNDEFGNIYAKVVSEARRLVETGGCHGRFELIVPVPHQ